MNIIEHSRLEKRTEGKNFKKQLVQKQMCTFHSLSFLSTHRDSVSQSFDSDDGKPSERPKGPHSPPLTPNQQLEIMIKEEEEIKKKEGEATEQDLEVTAIIRK